MAASITLFRPGHEQNDGRRLSKPATVNMISAVLPTPLLAASAALLIRRIPLLLTGLLSGLSLLALARILHSYKASARFPSIRKSVATITMIAPVR
jgi:hypothetical protein